MIVESVAKQMPHGSTNSCMAVPPVLCKRFADLQQLQGLVLLGLKRPDEVANATLLPANLQKGKYI